MKSFLMHACALALLILTGAEVPAQTPQQVLDFYVGTWSGKTTFKNAPTPLKAPVDTAMIVKKAVGGKYIEMDNVMYIPGNPEETVTLITFDPYARLFDGWTFNSDGPGARISTAPPEDPMKLTFTSPGMLAHGQSTAYRQTLMAEKRDEFELTFEVRHYDEKQKKDIWAVVYTTDFTRKANGG